MRSLSVRLSYKESITNVLTFIIIAVGLYWAFISFNKSSHGMLCILFSVIIIIINYKLKNIIEIMPFVVMCVTALSLFVLSGKTGERGFNAPVNHALRFVYLMFAVAMSIGIRELSHRNKTIVIKWALICIIISAVISTYTALFIDQYAIRYQGDRGFTNVVDFNQFYGICFVLCALFYAVFGFYKSASVKKQIVLCCLLMLFVAASLFVTGVLLCIMGFCMSLILYMYSRSKSKLLAWAVLFVIILCIAFVFKDQISDFVYKATEPMNWILRDRIRSVAEKVLNTNYNLSYSYDRREELANYSLTTFKRHILWGIGYSQYGYGVIGGHQEWQDMLGVYGIFGTFFFALAMIFFVRNTVKNIYNPNDLYAFLVAFILFFVLGFLNPCLSLPTLSAVFVVAPNMSCLFPCKKGTA